MSLAGLGQGGASAGGERRGAGEEEECFHGVQQCSSQLNDP